MTHAIGTHGRAALQAATVLGILAACGEAPATFDLADEPRDGGGPALSCTIPTGEIFNGGPGKDGIPALTNPTMVGAEDAGAEYLRDDDRVVGLLVADQPIAIPLNIGWWHEIVNLDVAGTRLAVSICPLTGSSLIFDRAPVGGAEFGVSGLLFQNNLIMYDRNTNESLWPQMMRGSACGDRRGTRLPMLPAFEMSWAGWRALHPGTRVVSSSTGFPRNYRAYPYGAYDVETNPELLFPVPRLDSRRPPKERVLGVAVGEKGGVAFPYGSLDRLGAVAAVHENVAGTPIVVFWDRAARGAMAFRVDPNGRARTFEIRDGRIVDVETGSSWRLDGRADAGPLEGVRLEPVPEAFVAFWFAWALFYPEARLWTS